MSLSRAELVAIAKSEGKKRYFSGVPCDKGHMSERYLTGHCVECSLAKAKISKAKNRGKYKEQSQQYNKRYYHENREREIARVKKYENDNKEMILAKAKEYRLKNAKRRNEQAKEWRKNNQATCRSHEATRRAREKSGNGYTQKQIDAMLLEQDYKCVYCEKDISVSRHIDHIMPLALGGLNDISNIQILCPKCNLSKHRKHPDEFAKEKCQSKAC